jgi:hypothetical protein
MDGAGRIFHSQSANSVVEHLDLTRSGEVKRIATRQRTNEPHTASGIAAVHRQ